MNCRLHFLWPPVLCALLAGCGTPGAPQPPSLELPRRVEDLSATRKGSRVTLAWTAPRENTDGTLVKNPPTMRICRGVGQVAMVACESVGEVPAAGGKAAQQPVQQSYTDTLPAELQQQNPTGFAGYAVEAMNRRGRSNGLSNQVQVPLAPAAPPPEQAKAQVTQDGVKVTAGGEGGPADLSDYHLYRRTDGAAIAVDLGKPNGGLERMGRAFGVGFLDRTAEWEKTYFYHVTWATTVSLPGSPAVQLEGDDSAEVKIFVHDVFPPAVPTGVQAVASGVGQAAFVDLTWAPNTESDLAGYNVYRHEEGAAAVKINAELVRPPSFRDRDVQPGHKYYYAVSAVDLRGNETGRSAEANEAVPPGN